MGVHAMHGQLCTDSQDMARGFRVYVVTVDQMLSALLDVVVPLMWFCVANCRNPFPGLVAQCTDDS